MGSAARNCALRGTGRNACCADCGYSGWYDHRGNRQGGGCQLLRTCGFGDRHQRRGGSAGQFEAPDDGGTSSISRNEDHHCHGACAAGSVPAAGAIPQQPAAILAAGRQSASDSCPRPSHALVARTNRVYRGRDRRALYRDHRSHCTQRGGPDRRSRFSGAERLPSEYHRCDAETGRERRIGDAGRNIGGERS